MSVEILGILHYSNHSEAFPRATSEFDPTFIRDCAQAHDRSGFDRVLIANSARRPDSIPLAAYAACATENLKFMIAHRPGFVAPTMAARMLATVDQVSNGRCGVHIITGGDEPDMQRDGDFVPKDLRYDRSREYVEVLRRMWSSPEPFDHEGTFYTFKQAFAEVKPVRDDIHVFWGGTSAKAVETGAAVADTYALPGFSLEPIRDLIGKVRAQAAQHDRDPDFLVSLRVICEDTEAQAWERADGLLRTMVEMVDRQGKLVREPGESREAAIRRVMEQSAEGALNHRIWSALARVPTGRPAMNCLVGGRQELLGTLMEYYDAGVRRFILSGYEPIPDAYRFGQGLLPDFRAAVAEREGGAALRSSVQ